MGQPLWKGLVEQLEDEGFESPYLNRLRSRLNHIGSRQTLEQEILTEMAAALSRAAAKVDAALLRLEVTGKALDAAPEPALRQRFNTEREAALRARWELKVHREALGMYDNSEINTHYPVPPRR